ncbi:MAG: FAD-dependent oxidoreductase [Alphaproteobacteria bacterium]
MPFEMVIGPERKSIAVVGAGISGLGAAYALAGLHDVAVFEAEDRLGGHARTVFAGPGRDIAVDTGFIVYNERNYPLLTSLFRELDVPTKASDMSFAATFDGGRLEYGLRGPKALFAQRRNAARPAFLAMLRDILRFNRRAEQALDRPDLSLGDFLDMLRVGDAFRRWYILPFSGAIWSATPDEMLAFPAATFVRFFKNHGLLAASGQPAWRTVEGGSVAYVGRMEAALRAKGAAVHVGARVEAVLPGDRPRLRVAGAATQSYDAVVLACHSDQALRLLGSPDEDQTRILGALRYKANRAVLHDDPGLMPKRRACWSSWNYIGAGDRQDIGVTYWMNRLQGLPTDRQLFVTLNPPVDVPDERIFDTYEFAHPQFDRAAIAAQGDLPDIQGRGGVYFAGAYARNGFHEDGLASGLDAARRLGATPAWA